jgi:vacuolar protein sorting-associated protein VTA1
VQPQQPEYHLPQQPQNIDLSDPSSINFPTPPKDPEEKNPGGFVAFDPHKSNIPFTDPSQNTSTVSPEVMIKAQKYCKFAGSALTYDDVPTAIDNLQKALLILTTGRDS